MRATKRSTRLKALEELLLTSRRPVPIKDLAERFNAHRSSINRMLRDLEMEWDVPIERDQNRSVWIDRKRYLADVRLSLDEVVAVFLAARLLARYSDKPNPHAVGALRKLSIALQRIAPQVAGHIALTSEKLDRPQNDSAKDYIRALETLARAWADGTRVRLYQQKSPDTERLFEPYFIEPSAVGYLTYVIGLDMGSREIRTFTIDRLARVTPTHEPYSIPIQFDPLKLLAGAWGVNWGKGEPVQVVLRFAPGRAADRVRETNWHETQVIDDLPDGGCEMRIHVGSTQEMKPWIRQWGHECEVLGPPELRREIGEEMRRAGELYSS